jgi:uncharacterized protein YunC (DUF1805 family)
MFSISVKSLKDGKAMGASVKWQEGQFCFIVTKRGLLGCGIFDVNVLNEMDFIGALIKGTKEKPHVEPEDLLDGKVRTVSERLKG